MKKIYFVLIVFFSLIFRNNVYAGNTEDTVFLYVGEKYVIEQQADNPSTCTSENEGIASIEKQILTGKASGETYVVIHNADNTEKRLHVFVGDYKLCLGQKKTMEFNLSSIINAWDSSAKSSDTSVASIRKQGYEGNYATFLLNTVSTGITNITINKSGSVLENFTVVVQEHPLAYCELTEPTCSQEGSIAHYECLFCKKYFSDPDGQEPLDDVSIDKIEHNYILTKIEEATCSENGYAEYVCENCQHSETQLLPAGHIYESKAINPTCTNQGYTIYTCNKCGHSYKDSYINALGHNYAITSYINYNSIIQKKCTICKNTTYEMNIKGMMTTPSLYQPKDTSSDYNYAYLNQEYFIASDLESSEDASVYIKYKRPIRDSSGKLKIYDIKMIYEDWNTKQVRYDNAINNISFSYDDSIFDESEVEVGPGISQCELIMDYDYDDNEIDDEESDGEFSYYYPPYEDIGNKHYSILGITFKLKFESIDKNPYKKTPTQNIEFSKRNLKIAKGFSKNLKIIYDRHSEYMTGSLKWKSSNKKIATVNSSGKVTAKKSGKCTITCQLPNGKKAKCKITVVKNAYKGKSLSKCNAYKGMYGNINFEVNKAYYNKNKFILRCVVMNTRILKVKKFNWITISARDTYGHILAKEKFKDVPIDLNGYGKKYITFTFPKNAVKKKRELHQGVWITTKYSCQRSY